ncbi:hypothetical protein, partial [Streptomyces sp. NPDC051098]|uniref:hypothetical protein n=1 Tax=Streptomyces sp. NPDC051098 TaxID=3155411 RepID=UPI003426D741
TFATQWIATATADPTGADGRVIAVVVWLLAVAGWAAQDAVAGAAQPVFAAFAGLYAATALWAALRRRAVSGSGPAV